MISCAFFVLFCAVGLVRGGEGRDKMEGKGREGRGGEG